MYMKCYNSGLIWALNTGSLLSIGISSFTVQMSTFHREENWIESKKNSCVKEYHNSKIKCNDHSKEFLI